MTQEGNVDVCPVTKEAWEARAEAKKGGCGGQSVYHCLADNEGRKWEKCVERSLIKEDVFEMCSSTRKSRTTNFQNRLGFCPVFSSKGFIDWKPCNTSAPTCPNSSYVSNEVYKHIYCFGNNSLHEQKSEDLTKAEGVDVGLVIFFVLASVCIIAAALTMIVIIWRKRSGANTQNDEELLLLSNGRGKSSAEIVKETIDTGVQLLLQKTVKSVVVLGKFGNAVSSTCCRISTEFGELNNWTTLECRYTDIPITVSEKTILFVYGWFGIWNDDLCSVDRAQVACQSLIRILSKTTDVKLIIGMRSDLHRKYHQELEAEKDENNMHLFNHEINLDSANIKKDAEYGNYFYKNIKNECQKDHCACQTLTYEMLQTGNNIAVGMPIKLTLIEKYHDLIYDYKGEWDILMVMRDHFISLENDERKRHVYAWITYICLKGQFTRAEQFDTELVKQIGIHIDKSSFNENDKDLRRYFRVRNSNAKSNVSPENAQYVFWHRFIYICAFKYLFDKDPELIIKYCNIDTILQLVRPRGAKTTYFEVTADEHCVNLFNERIHELNLAESYEDNPLVKSRTWGTKKESQELH